MDLPSMPQNGDPLTLEKLVFELVLRPSKGLPCETTHNPNAWVAQHYSIVEDIT